MAITPGTRVRVGGRLEPGTILEVRMIESTDGSRKPVYIVHTDGSEKGTEYVHGSWETVAI